MSLDFSNPGGQVVLNVMGITCPPPLAGIGLTEAPNSGWAKAYPAHPLKASLLKNSSSKRNVLTLSIYYLPAAIMLFFDKFRQVQLPTEVAEAVVKTEAGRSSMQSFKELWLVK
jgi:hypothetical protein